jgi:hypothetical protein
VTIPTVQRNPPARRSCRRARHYFVAVTPLWPAPGEHQAAPVAQQSVTGAQQSATRLLATTLAACVSQYTAPSWQQSAPGVQQVSAQHGEPWKQQAAPGTQQLGPRDAGAPTETSPAVTTSPAISLRNMAFSLLLVLMVDGNLVRGFTRGPAPWLSPLPMERRQGQCDAHAQSSAKANVSQPSPRGVSSGACGGSRAGLRRTGSGPSRHGPGGPLR